MAAVATSAPRARTAARWLLAAGLGTAGLGHLTFARKDFQAQVPEWMPMDEDGVVMASGGVELCLGAALLGLPRERRRLGWIMAAFFVAVSREPSSVHPPCGRVGYDTDLKRGVRLLGQPLLISWAIWSTR